MMTTEGRSASIFTCPKLAVIRRFTAPRLRMVKEVKTATRQGCSSRAEYFEEG